MYQKQKSGLKMSKKVVVISSSPRIGGNSDYFLIINNIEQLKEIISICKEYNKKYFIIGNGTNLLFTDKGFRGVIIKLKLEEYKIDFEEEYGIIHVESGFSLVRLARIAQENGLTGLEFASRNTRNYRWSY